MRQQIEDAGGLKLIYIDPPFDVGADFSMDVEIGGETFHKEANLLEQIAYRDTWGRGADSFISRTATAGRVPSTLADCMTSSCYIQKVSTIHGTCSSRLMKKVTLSRTTGAWMRKVAVTASTI